jgi:hypothetical protein
MAAIAQVAAQANGAATSPVTVTASDTFKPHPRGTLIFKTTGTASNVTFQVPGSDDLLQARPDPVVALAATDEKAVATGPYVPYADVNGDVTYTTSSQTGCTVRYVVT